MRNRLFILAAALLFSSCAEKGDIDAADLLACGVFDPEKQICDKRDGNVYKFVKIDAQIWLAENLKYESPSSVCYDYDDENCEKYGRLYPWNNEENQKLCPEDWHIPYDSDWKKLNASDYELKAKNGWDRFTIGDKTFDGNGGNGYGFDALPAGISLFEYKSDSENCKNEETYALPKWNGLGEATAFMSSISEYKIFLSSDTSRVACMAKNSLVSVRCIKN